MPRQLKPLLAEMGITAETANARRWGTLVNGDLLEAAATAGFRLYFATSSVCSLKSNTRSLILSSMVFDGAQLFQQIMRFPAIVALDFLGKIAEHNVRLHCTQSLLDLRFVQVPDKCHRIPPLICSNHISIIAFAEWTAISFETALWRAVSS
jgi:hypothetical protein